MYTLCVPVFAVTYSKYKTNTTSITKIYYKIINGEHRSLILSNSTSRLRSLR